MCPDSAVFSGRGRSFVHQTVFLEERLVLWCPRVKFELPMDVIKGKIRSFSCRSQHVVRVKEVLQGIFAFWRAVLQCHRQQAG
ncbi:MAG: hypothetical protein CSA52_03660 [Gammaproteobacteria bacterium]|nr:MAG: hypothetical protein CSB48_06065 [Pseudomonadota bacterium]PIE38122.1 MAG: hypothetical protein CSA52_03660 [Gammaproteobacteria bacterium]